MFQRFLPHKTYILGFYVWYAITTEQRDVQLLIRTVGTSIKRQKQSSFLNQNNNNNTFVTLHSAFS